MDLLDKKIQVTKSEYEAESKKVLQNAWIEYRGKEADPAAYDAYVNPGAPALTRSRARH
jgi:hypothetical protein